MFWYWFPCFGLLREAFLLYNDGIYSVFMEDSKNLNGDLGEKAKIVTIDGNHDGGTTPEAKVLRHQRQLIKSFRSKYNAKRKWYNKFADWMTGASGTILFLILNFIWFGGWVIWNNGLIPGLMPFDPYPYSFLTMIVSLEAIMLSIIVLISENRQADIADLREEIDFNINVRAEQEITKILNILDEIHDHLGLNPEDDEDLIEMKKDTNLDEIEQQIANDYDNNGKQS